MDLAGAELELARQYGFRSETAFKSVGCDRCRQTGFHGREGIFELLFVNREVNDILSTDPSLKQLREAAIKAEMVPMIRHGLHKAIAGRTTIAEVGRTCGSAEGS